ncbi:MAG: sugar ABC transporter permease [Defluviitaleaceae bacterium]|nr:sugar ABC transporter permease [Defluviitaleaceae bacterium]MCL2238508.1 sugar ABC transporter permease [Defluviitaleaceae bacterium]
MAELIKSVKPSWGKVARFMNRDGVVGYIFALPFVIGFLFIMLVPMGMSFYYSFTDFNMRPEHNFIGFYNYTRMFSDDRFWNAISVTFRFVIFSVPVRMVFGLLIAYALTRKYRGSHAYRAVYYLPTLIGGSVAVALVWRQLFVSNGVVYNLFTFFGFEGIGWFGIPHLAIVPLIVMSVWQFGAAMIIFAAGIKDIPESYIEAASIDGANKFHIFFKIILPYLSPVILFNLVMQTISAFMTFTQAYIITGGGPAESTNFIALYIYNHAFTWGNMGYASAMSWILLLIVAVVTFTILRTSRRWTFYADEN